MVLSDEARNALTSASDVLVADPDLDLLEAVLDAREDAGSEGEWRLLLSDAVADTLDYEFVLGTRVEQNRRAGELVVRRTASPPGRLIVTSDSAFAVAGPPSSRSLLSTRQTADAVQEVVAEQFAAARPANVDVPARDTLVASAAETLSAGFAADLDAALAGAERLHRSSDVNALTLLVAIGARQGHLFGALRTWADDVGVAPRQLFSDEKQLLSEKGLIETIKLPLGKGHPRSRLRLTDEVLADCPPRNFRERLEERVQGSEQGQPAATREREPVWKRTNRTAGPD